VPWIVPGPVISGVGAWFDRSLGDNYLRYVGYPIGTPTSTVDTFPFTERAFDRLVPEAVRSDALNLDLSAFRRAGGKLIIAQGWGDQAIPPAGTLDYYQRLAERNGGLRQTQEWARLFMVPSMFHCTGGTTLTGADPLRQLVAWVEHGTAPDRIIATGKDTAGNPLTRPVFPYPLVARYNGTGSIDDAANFHAVPPASPPHDVVHWAGDGLYEIPGPVAR
jgi:feruloyl esterase